MGEVEARAERHARAGLIAARDVDNARNLHNVALSWLAVAISAAISIRTRCGWPRRRSTRQGPRVAEAEVARREATLGIAVKRPGGRPSGAVRGPIEAPRQRRGDVKEKYAARPGGGRTAKYTAMAPSASPSPPYRPAHRRHRGGHLRPQLRGEPRACPPSRSRPSLALEGRGVANTPMPVWRFRQGRCPDEEGRLGGIVAEAVVDLAASARCSWSLGAVVEEALDQGRGRQGAWVDRRRR